MKDYEKAGNKLGSCCQGGGQGITVNSVAQAAIETSEMNPLKLKK